MLTLAAADTLAAAAQTATTVSLTIFGMELVGTTETYKVLYQGQPGTSAATVYTAPATAFVKSISVVNTAGSAQTFALYRGGTAAVNRLTPDLTLPGGGWATWEDGLGWQVYRSTGQILAGAVLDLLTGNVSGPNPYAAGGFTVDLTASVSSVDFFGLAVLIVGPNLPPHHCEYTLNSPDPGKVKVKVMRHRYDKLDAGNSATSQPGGVTLATTSGQLSVAAAGTVSTAVNALSVDALGTGNAQNTSHQHSHQHAMNVLYQHTHAATETNAASVELGAVDLSGTTWRYLAVGA